MVLWDGLDTCFDISGTAWRVGCHLLATMVAATATAATAVTTTGLVGEVKIARATRRHQSGWRFSAGTTVPFAGRRSEVNLMK